MKQTIEELREKEKETEKLYSDLIHKYLIFNPNSKFSREDIDNIFYHQGKLKGIRESILIYERNN